MKSVPTETVAGDALAQEFVKFAVEAGVLRFGEFKTKAARLSPYFFDAGLFNDGAKLGRLAQFYARRLQACGIEFDVVFGPAYKGITLAAGLAVELARLGQNVGYCYNRKEPKDHGEGGSLVGAELSGQVLIIDDVLSAGTSVRESVGLIESAGGKPCGVIVALDRQEKTIGGGAEASRSAAQFIEQEMCLNVSAIARLHDLLHYLQSNADPMLSAHYARVAGYRESYGV